MGVHRDCRDEENHAGRRRSRTKDLFEIRSGRHVSGGRYRRCDRPRNQPALGESCRRSSHRGSGWTLVAVDRLEVSTAQFNPIGGSSYIPSPKRIANTRACINVQNEQDEFCFLYTIAASVLKMETKMLERTFQISRLYFRTEN